MLPESCEIFMEILNPKLCDDRNMHLHDDGLVDESFNSTSVNAEEVLHNTFIVRDNPAVMFYQIHIII